MRLRTGWVSLRPGVCLWLRPGWAYTATQDPARPVSLSFMHFDLVDARGRLRPRHAALPPEFIDLDDPELAIAIARRMVEVCTHFGTATVTTPPYEEKVATLAAALFTSLLIELDVATDISTASPAPQVSPYCVRLVRQAVTRINADLCEMPSVAELARQSRYSVSRFPRIFKHVTGESPRQYMTGLRLRRAERLLRRTDMSVCEVAEATGYRDVSFFSRQFREHHGLSPLRYRSKRVESQPDEMPYL
ncbi:MAG: AraC family transcriptional regulator [Kiritimatiellae bacterium]|nr:AraC family transcriptional regulator [Kiritimatiellia bacterium]